MIQVVKITGGLLALLFIALVIYVRTPLDLSQLNDTSITVRDRTGYPIQLRLNSTGKWRESVSLDDIDPRLVEALIAYEDQRFFAHSGVDLLAVARAGVSFVLEAHIVSGASTITMQLARLLNPDMRERSVLNKLRQMLFALRIEQHLEKPEILEAYFTLAPYGGNIEGVVAASWAWFGRTPMQLTASEIGLLVALPQSPERRRPDRNVEVATSAKNHVLETIAPRLGFTERGLSEYLEEGLNVQQFQPPSLANHLLDVNLERSVFSEASSINADWQYVVQGLLTEQLTSLDAPINGAVLIAERRTGAVRVYHGSSDYNSTERLGANNYLATLRSPGSSLKPFIYAFALDRGLIEPNHVFSDRALQRDGYAPSNFDSGFWGDVTLREALVTSRNVPAVRTLEMLGSGSIVRSIENYLQRNTQLPDPGLSLAVGGYYVTAEQLTELYLGLADPGDRPSLVFQDGMMSSHPEPLVSERTSEVIQSLMSVDRVDGSTLVAKTGTSQDRQDAWAVLITRDHVVTVWFGTPNNEETVVLTGAEVALPFAQRVERALMLSPPSVSPPTFASPGAALERVSCPILLEYPEDGEWIRSDDLRIAIGVNGRDTQIYVDGRRADVTGMYVELARPGAHAITAESGFCNETVNIFLERP
ncbi:hypothetical protein FZCC0069_08985 [Rhodobacterales bacterium FZCC0069]|nr:hypothetical protein [Rhodobacterales bacterium FZCC0069]